MGPQRKADGTVWKQILHNPVSTELKSDSLEQRTYWVLQSVPDKNPTNGVLS